VPPVLTRSVLIVSYQTPRLTARAAESALRLTHLDKVIVVDNASGDDTVQLLSALKSDRLLIVTNVANVGFGAAHNLGAAAATGDILIFLNSDAELSEQAASRLVDEVVREGGRCISGPRLVSPDGAIQRSAGLLPGPFDLTVRALGLSTLATRIADWPTLRHLTGLGGLAHEYDSAVRVDSAMSTTMVSGACFATSRNAFDELGGFDERFFLYFEDADLCRRALKAGMAIRYVPEAVVPHVGGASSSEDYHFGPRHARAMRQYLGKWYGPAGASLAVMLMFLRAVATSVGSPRRAGRAWRAVGATLGIGGGA
jgi:N-acetylglucosaminyl-diphospho-decaprenol L-rhamnosyltransferase